MGAQFESFKENMQDRFKTSSYGLFTLFLKLFSGFVLGLTFSLIGDELFGYQTFLFVFVILAIMGAFMHIAKKWSLMSLLLFDGFCILLGAVLNLYIQIAPGA